MIGFSLGLAALLVAWFLSTTLKNRQRITSMTGMMVAMAGGMSAGLIAGLAVGALLSSSLGTASLVGMAAGGAAGAALGLPVGLLPVLDGLLSGIMGGLMGAMLGAMLPAGALPPLLLGFMVVFVLTGGLLLLLLRSQLPDLHVPGAPLVRRAAHLVHSFPRPVPTGRPGLRAVLPLGAGLGLAAAVLSFLLQPAPAALPAVREPTPNAAATSPEVVVTLNGHTFSPNPVRLQAGMAVRLTLVNHGRGDEALALPDFAPAAAVLRAQAGGRGTIVVTPPAPGRYEVGREAHAGLTFIVH